MSAHMESVAPHDYIVGRGFDWTFFLAPPLLALAVGIMISGIFLHRKRI